MEKEDFITYLFLFALNFNLKKQPAQRIPCNAVRVPKSNSFYKEDPVAAIQTWKSMFFSSFFIKKFV